MSAKEMPNEKERNFRYRWVVLFACFFAFVVYAFVFQLIPPLLTTLQNQFGIDDTQAGLLVSLAVLPGIILALPAGLIVSRYGFRLLGFLSIVAVAVGSMMTAVANDFVTALLGRIILGVGGAFLVAGAPTFIPQWFQHEEMGKAMGIYGINMPVATIISFPTATVLAQLFNWRYPFYVGTIISLVCAMVFVVIIKEGPFKGKSEAVKAHEVKRAIGTLEVWKASIVWAFFNGTMIAFLSWAPKLFSTFKNLDNFYSSILASLVMYSAILFVPFFGWISDKLERRKPFIVAGSAAMAVTLMLSAYAYDVYLILSILSLGIAAATIPPLTMAIVAISLPPRLSGIGFSIVTLCQNVGIFLSTPWIGYLLQTTQSLSLTFLGVSLFAVAGTVAGMTLKTK